MPTYHAPLRDMRFVLHELLDVGSDWKAAGLADVSAETVDAVLAEAARLCEEVIAPLNASGDQEGCHFENGAVRTPAGFAEAYKAFADGGWTALACDPAYGGQGLPVVVKSCVQEMICSANMAFGMYPGLSGGAYSALHAHASDAIKARYLPKLVDGRWSGTMCLTEPHCGTDLGLIRTVATPQADGSYRVSGTKIFISAGEHDLTENIVHLVLARTPDAPAGIAGISLFVVPKFVPDADGAPGARNGVRCARIEHKMGINASATCEMIFEDAAGHLVGTLNRGMAAMFTMMNEARLGVGMQGLGVAEAAYQGAVAYARERRQGRALEGAKEPDAPADPIVVHPDVRRMLLTMRACVEGARALAGWVAQELDRQSRAEDADARQASEDLVALMTPIVKALFTDFGSEAANLGMQVFGGHGYIRDNGMEQLVRDARIAQIYEGTNGIQALDLLGRKLPAHAGRMLRRFFHPAQAFVDSHKDDPAMAEFVTPLARALGGLQKITVHLAQTGLGKPEEAAAGATEYLRAFGLVALALIWARMAEVALAKADDADEADFYKAKLATARFYMQRILPQTAGLMGAIMGGGKTLMAFDAAQL